MRMRPRVTVIIPTYNAARTLPKALESLQAQTVEDWECIVTDGGSSDMSYNIARAFGERDPRIWAMRVDGPSGRCAGRARAVNAAASRAGGEYVANLDADDYYLEDFLEKACRALDRTPSVSGVYSHFIEWHEADSVKRIHRCPEFERDALVRGNYIAFSTLVVRGEMRLSAAWEPIADWELLLRLSRDRPLLLLPEILSVRRFHAAQVSRGLGGARTILRKLLLPYLEGGFVNGMLAAFGQAKSIGWHLAKGRSRTFEYFRSYDEGSANEEKI